MAVRDILADRVPSDAMKKEVAMKEPSPIFSTTYESTILGPITLASDGTSIIGLWMDGQKYFASTVRGSMALRDDLPILNKAKAWLDRYFAGEDPAPTELSLAPYGSPFRQRVWKKLLEIPYGKTRTYGAIAEEIALEDGRTSMSAQAVGGAVGHNPISIIIPCHRVVGSNGSLTGYAGGIDKKVRLLELEGALEKGLFIPTKGTAF